MNRQQPDVLQEERENMKSLVLGITGDIARLISGQGFQKDLRILDLLIFGMFVVTKTYMTARRNSEKTNSQIAGFHREMLDYATNEYFIKSPVMKDRKVLGPADAAEVFSKVDKFHKEFLSRSEFQYVEYENALKLDLENPASIFSETSGAMIASVFVEQPAIEEKNALLVPLGLKLAELYMGCLKSFKT